ncbi:MAG: LamG domain-containing protein [Candidatus Gastranaerophilaceae bacterium]
MENSHTWTPNAMEVGTVENPDVVNENLEFLKWAFDNFNLPHKFCVNSGNVTSDVADLLAYSSGTLSTKTGGSYANAVGSNAQGTQITLNTAATLDMSGYANGTYNIFAKPDGTLEALNNTIYRQPNEPQPLPDNMYNACPKNGLLGYYKLNGNLNNEASGYPLTLTGTATYTTGKYTDTQAMTLNSSNYIMSNSLATGANAKSTGFIFKTTSASNRIFTNGTVAGGTPPYWGASTNANGTFHFETGSGSNAINSTAAVNDGNWHFVMVTYDGTSLSLYIDGALVGTVTAGSLGTSPSNLYFGYESSGETVSDVSVYNRALTASEVSSMWNTSPVPLTNSVWLNTSVEPFTAQKYTSNTVKVDFLDIPLGTATVANGLITAVTTNPYNQNGYDVNYQTQGYRFPNKSLAINKSANTTYTAECDLWAYFTSTNAVPINKGETYSYTSVFTIYPAKGAS